MRVFAQTVTYVGQCLEQIASTVVFPTRGKQTEETGCAGILYRELQQCCFIDF